MPEFARKRHKDEAARVALNLRARIDDILDDLAHDRPVRGRTLLSAIELDRQLDGVSDMDEILARQERSRRTAA